MRRWRRAPGARLSFGQRIGLIVVLSLAAAWLGSTLLFYASRADEGVDARPLPGQIAALVDLLEHTPAPQWPLVLRAVTSETFDARIEPGLAIGTTERRQRVTRVASRALAAYLQALGGRPVSVVVWNEPGEVVRSRWGARVSFARPVDLEFRIGLKTGETLQVRARGVPITALVGLPVGFIAGLFGTGIGLMALFAMNRETRPLARLAAAVDGIDLATAPKALPQARSSAPEIGALVAAFNRLQERLALLLRARMAMLGGISHDVRSFATRLRLRVEHLPDAAERERAAGDIDDMIRLLDDALLASRAGAGELVEELVEFDALVQAEVDDRRAQGGAVAWLSAGGSGEALVLGDRLALRRVVANLIDNALAHGQAARVSVQVGTQDVVLVVDDQGPGIPPEQREAVLEPFVRLESSRSRRTGGAGLGLAIVRNLVEAHQGQVTIDDAPGGGARFTVRLPAFRA